MNISNDPISIIKDTEHTITPHSTPSQSAPSPFSTS